MYAMYYASMPQCWQLVKILVRTNHPYLRVGRHIFVVKNFFIELCSVMSSLAAIFTTTYERSHI
jgi:hypothetical protein